MGKRIQQNSLNAVDRGETQFAGRIEAYLMELGNHVATVLAGQKAAGDVDIPERYQQQLTDELTALWTDTMRQSFADSASVMGMNIAWDVANPRVQDTISGLAERVVMIDDSTKNMVRAAVARQTSEGRTMDQLAADIRAGNVEAFSKSRAVTIARTESAVAYSQGSVLAYRDAGIEKVEVMDGKDFDDACRLANGQIWSLDYAMGHSIQHPNCTRALLPVIELAR
jgi:SPP1 gp7 family putative phage head morphogenesis protein